MKNHKRQNCAPYSKGKEVERLSMAAIEHMVVNTFKDRLDWKHFQFWNYKSRFFDRKVHKDF